MSTVDDVALRTNDTVVAAKLDRPRVIENVLQVLPDTTNIAVVIGASPAERFWAEEWRRATQPDFNDIVAEALRILAPEAKKHGLTLRRKGIQQPLPVLADRIHLHQVMLNWRQTRWMRWLASLVAVTR